MSETNTQQERNWAMFCHLGALSIWLGVPFGNIVIPLLLWLIKKDEIPLVNLEGKESLNFEISISMYAIAIVLLGISALIFDSVDESFPWLILLLLIALAITQVVLVIIAAIKVSGGESFKYPLTIRFIQ
jgi:uncharacterized Tic20 family protein